MNTGKKSYEGTAVVFYRQMLHETPQQSKHEEGRERGKKASQGEERTKKGVRRKGK